MTWLVLIQDPANPEGFIPSGLPNFVGTPDEAEAYRQSLEAENTSRYAMQYVSGT
jgi:hypothetical protein